MESLTSNLFTKKPNNALKNCLNDHSSHISLNKNSTGEHVELIQTALTRIKDNDPGLGIPAFEVNGTYDGATADAILRYKQKRDIVNRSYQNAADKIVGKMTLQKLDEETLLLEQGRRGGGLLIPTDPMPVQKDLAARDSLLALSWVNLAISAIALYKAALIATLGGGNAILPPKVSEALDIHFHLIDPKPSVTGAIRRSITLQDAIFIQSNLIAIQGVLSNKANFENSTGCLGEDGKINPGVPACAPFGGHIFFTPVYKGFTDAKGEAIGPNSRAAILVHEATHVIDTASHPKANHISEFSPAYESMKSDNMLHNSSSYASFAAMIATGHGKKPNDRFGLGSLRGS